MAGGSDSVEAVLQSDQPTITEIFPDRTEIHTFDSVSFTIHISANGNPVPNGHVTVRESTDYFYAVSGEIVDGTIVLEWVAQPWTPTGWCTFIATYEGTIGYEPSLATTEVSVGDPVPTGAWETEITIIPNVTIAWQTSSVTFTVSITILGGAFPFFSGGYISLVDNTENIVLQMQDIIPQATVTYVTSFTFNIPTWYSSGIHLIEARYTGSLEADHAPSNGICNLQILINGYSLSLSANTTVLNREEGNLLLNAFIDGDDPTAHQLTLKTIQNSTQVLLDDTTVTSRDYSFLFMPDYSYLLGDIEFELTLFSPLTGEIVAQERLFAIIIDTISIIHEFNADEYSVGDIVYLTTYSVETDMPTRSVQANITVRDLSIPLTLGPKTTDANGTIHFEWQIPEGTAGGIHQIEIEVTSLEPYCTETTVFTQIPVRGDIEFALTYPTSIQRGMDAVLNCTVLSDSVVINEGILNLCYQNSTIIWTTNLANPADYTYSVSLMHDLGPLTLLWEYEGTENYHSGNQSLSLTIFSEPYFDVLIPNCTNVVQGKTVCINGHLLDETGQGVAGLLVTLWDNGQLFATLTTMENGSFTYDYTIPLDATIGLHVIEAQFAGDYSQFRLPANNSGACTLTVRVPLHMTMTTSLIGGETTSIQIEGTPYEEIELSWSPLNASLPPWYTIGILTLDPDGQGSWVWEIPSFKGNISVRAANPVGDMIFTEATIHVKAEVTLTNWVNEAEVQTNVLIEGEVSEEYRLFIDHTAISTWESAGIFQHIVNFQTRGLHTFTVQTRGNYVLAENFTYDITVLEPLNVTLDLPASIYAGSGITGQVTVEGFYEGPVIGLTVELSVDGGERVVTTTSADGKAFFTFSLSPGTYNITCETQGQASYYRDVQVFHTLLVRSTTQLTLSHAELYYHENCTITADVQDELGDPIFQIPVEFMISGDQGITWTSLGTSTTDDNGRSWFSWFNKLTPGIYLIKAAYSGSIYYEAISTTIEVEIHKNEIFTSWGSLESEYESNIILNASLATPTGTAISDPLDMSLTIFYNNQWLLLATEESNNSGVVLFFFALDFLPGNYTVKIVFNGNTHYQSGSWQGELLVTQKQTVVSLEETEFHTTYGELQSISVSITTLSGTSLKDIDVHFYVQKEQTTYFDHVNRSNSEGHTTFQFHTRFPEGTYTLYFDCYGNITYAASSISAELIVSKGTASLEPKIDDSIIEYGTNIRWCAYVSDIQGKAIPRIPITFSTSLTGIYWDIWGTVETNESGYAVLEIRWLQDVQNHYGPPGEYTLKIVIEDNPYVASKQDKRAISIIKTGVTISLESCIITKSSTAIIQGSLVSNTGNAIQDALVILSWNGTETEEWEEFLVVTSTEYGSFYAEKKIALPSTYSIKAEYLGDTYHTKNVTMGILDLETGAINDPNILISTFDAALGEKINIEISKLDPTFTPKTKLIILTENFIYEEILNVSNPSLAATIYLNENFPLATYTISVQLQLNNGTWIIYNDLAVFVISTNSVPTLNVNWDRLSLDDGEVANYAITAFDSLGIGDISIIRLNETITVDLAANNTATGELRFHAPGTYLVEVIATDKAGAANINNFTFVVNGKGPEFLNIYPSKNILAELHSPLLLEVEMLVTDLSGIESVILYVNSTDYSLTFTDSVWHTSVELSEGTYFLWSVATDIHGIESRYELGKITPRLDETTSSNIGELTSKSLPSESKGNSSPSLLVGALGFSLVILMGNFLVNWRRKKII